MTRKHRIAWRVVAATLAAGGIAYDAHRSPQYPLWYVCIVWGVVGLIVYAMVQMHKHVDPFDSL